MPIIKSKAYDKDPWDHQKNALISLSSGIKICPCCYLQECSCSCSDWFLSGWHVVLNIGQSIQWKYLLKSKGMQVITWKCKIVKALWRGLSVTQRLHWHHLIVLFWTIQVLCFGSFFLVCKLCWIILPCVHLNLNQSRYVFLSVLHCNPSSYLSLLFGSLSFLVSVWISSFDFSPFPPDSLFSFAFSFSSLGLVGPLIHCESSKMISIICFCSVHHLWIPFCNMWFWCIQCWRQLPNRTLPWIDQAWYIFLLPIQLQC